MISDCILIVGRPDNCDGSYATSCNYAPQYFNITNILEAAGQSSLLDYMNTYWQPNSGSSESFWEHEWNKHGTCINKLAPSCYGADYQAGQEVVDFFTKTVATFQNLDTYTALANAGITPDDTATYTRAEIQNALTAVTGSPVTIDCTSGNLNQVYYAFNIQGSLQSGTLQPIAAAKGTCPSSGIRYNPKQ